MRVSNIGGSQWRQGVVRSWTHFVLLALVAVLANACAVYYLVR